EKSRTCVEDLCRSAAIAPNRSHTAIGAGRNIDKLTRGVWAHIPARCNRSEPICFSPYLYRARNLVERFFSKMKQCRRVATRYDKRAANYLAFIQLASNPVMAAR